MTFSFEIIRFGTLKAQERGASPAFFWFPSFFWKPHKDTKRMGKVE